LFEELPYSDDVKFSTFQLLEDNFYRMGMFDAFGNCHIDIHTDLKVVVVRLKVHKASNSWVILSEIYFGTTD